MARNISLANVVAELKAVLAVSQVISVSNADDLRYATLLDNKQKQLCNEYDFPFLEDRWNVQVTNGNRYISFPTTDIDGNINMQINFERPVKLETWWAGQWQDCTPYGVGSEEYNWMDSDGANGPFGGAPDTLDPVQRWRFDSDTTFEIWPLPASTQMLRWTGMREPIPLISYSYSAGPPPGSTATPNWTTGCDLDDTLLWSAVATDILTEKGKPISRLIQGLYERHMNYIKQCYPRRTMECGFQSSKIKEYQKVTGIKQILTGPNLPQIK